MNLRWVEEVGPQPESRAIANAKWLRDNFCLSSKIDPAEGCLRHTNILAMVLS